MYKGDEVYLTILKQSLPVFGDDSWEYLLQNYPNEKEGDGNDSCFP
jgi:hypothetical protein